MESNLPDLHVFSESNVKIQIAQVASQIFAYTTRLPRSIVWNSAILKIPS